jgi:hypothetical protein
MREKVTLVSMMVVAVETLGVQLLPETDVMEVMKK